jgi:hypothetical protein
MLLEILLFDGKEASAMARALTSFLRMLFSFLRISRPCAAVMSPLLKRALHTLSGENRFSEFFTISQAISCASNF